MLALPVHLDFEKVERPVMLMVMLLKADLHIHVYLSLLFNGFMCHGYLPADFMKTAIVPINKCKTGNTADKNNYRLIALVTGCSENFELCL